MMADEETSAVLARARDSWDRRRGGNSTVVRLEWDERLVAVKDYNARADAATRLRREWEGLRLLHSLGLQITPEPLGADFALGFGVQEWVAGTMPVMDAATVSAMGSALRLLHDVSGGLAANGSEQRAADSIREVSDMRAQVNQRWLTLEGLGLPGLADLLNGLAAALEVVGALPGEAGQWVPTLSPSDFGPHNMLHDKASNGWRLIDLEFFGWDDAHKLVCDTLLHPLIRWEEGLAGLFLASAVDTYGLNPGRLMALYPWCSLKWATIVANRVARETEAGRLSQAEEAIAVAKCYLLRAVESTRWERTFTGLEALLQWETSQ